MFFIRTAAPGDAEKVRDLLVASWRATYVPIHGADAVEPVIARWHTTEAVRANLTARDGEMLVADNGEVIGGMAFARCSGDRKTVNFMQLYVHPHHLRQGIGRDLFAEIETCFPGAESLQLEVDRKNGAAVAFYAAHGLEITGETASCGSDSDIPAFIMSKRLV
jgi:ribosomal protein S18 acetylase RimI-like enzyme